MNPIKIDRQIRKRASIHFDGTFGESLILGADKGIEKCVFSQI